MVGPAEVAKPVPDSVPDPLAVLRFCDPAVLYDVEYDLVLGKGSYSTVFRATSRLTGERVAVKRVTKSRLATPRLVSNLAHEIAILEHISHPHCVSFIDAFQDSHHVYIVLELISGGELFDYIASRATLTEDDAAIITHQLLDALSYLHSNNIVHRDIKPENVLIHIEDMAPPPCPHTGLPPAAVGSTAGILLAEAPPVAQPINIIRGPTNRVQSHLDGSPLGMSAPATFGATAMSPIVSPSDATLIPCACQRPAQPEARPRLVIKLVDFGFARFCSQASRMPEISKLVPAAASHFSGATPVQLSPAGTVRYSAPEVLRAIAALGGRPRPTTGADAAKSDVFAVGVVVYLMLFGVFPWVGDSHLCLYQQQLQSAHKYRKGYRARAASAASRALLDSLLRADPKARPSAAEAMCDPWLAAVHAAWLVDSADREAAVAAAAARRALAMAPVLEQDSPASSPRARGVVTAVAAASGGGGAGGGSPYLPAAMRAASSASSAAAADPARDGLCVRYLDSPSSPTPLPVALPSPHSSRTPAPLPLGLGDRPRSASPLSAAPYGSTHALPRGYTVATAADTAARSAASLAATAGVGTPHARAAPWSFPLPTTVAATPGVSAAMQDDDHDHDDVLPMAPGMHAAASAGPPGPLVGAATAPHTPHNVASGDGVGVGRPPAAALALTPLHGDADAELDAAMGAPGGVPAPVGTSAGTRVSVPNLDVWPSGGAAMDVDEVAVGDADDGDDHDDDAEALAAERAVAASLAHAMGIVNSTHPPPSDCAAAAGDAATGAVGVPVCHRADPVATAIDDALSAQPSLAARESISSSASSTSQRAAKRPRCVAGVGTSAPPRVTCSSETLTGAPPSVPSPRMRSLLRQSLRAVRGKPEAAVAGAGGVPSSPLARHACATYSQASSPAAAGSSTSTLPALADADSAALPLADRVPAVRILASQHAPGVESMKAIAAALLQSERRCAPPQSPLQHNHAAPCHRLAAV